MVNKGCAGKQCRGAVGLTFLAFLSFLEVRELPQSWAVRLGVGQAAGLFLAVLSAVYCFFSSHKCVSSPQGSGTLCLKCKLPSFVGSFHCEICDICVPGYSHHSYWLNSCIGASNSLAYLSGSLGLGTAAVLQVATGLIMYALMLGNRSFALQLSEKYALRDQGCLFHLLLLFALLVSCFIAIACTVNAVLLTCRLFAVWRDRKTLRREADQKENRGNSALRYEEKPPLPGNLQAESFDSVAESSFRGKKLLLMIQSVEKPLGAAHP